MQAKPARPRRRSSATLRTAGAVVAVIAASWGISGLLTSGRTPHRHPQPRPDVTGEHVLHTFGLPREIPTTVAAYQVASRIAPVLDGVRCYCACRATIGHRSLLSCFEDDHGALCQVCQDEALIAETVTSRGGTLEQVREAVDARFGPPT